MAVLFLSYQQHTACNISSCEHTTSMSGFINITLQKVAWHFTGTDLSVKLSLKQVRRLLQTLVMQADIEKSFM